MTKGDLLQKERVRLAELFKDVEPAKRDLVAGLIEDAAFLAVENAELRRGLESTGMVDTRPGHPEQQRPIEAARQYRQNVGVYAVVIKVLNGVLSRDAGEDGDDGLEDYK